jgi:hypothetical protein
LSAFRYFLGVLRELCGKKTFFGGGVKPAAGIFIKQLSRGLHKPTGCVRVVLEAASWSSLTIQPVTSFMLIAYLETPQIRKAQLVDKLTIFD